MNEDRLVPMSPGGQPRTSLCIWRDRFVYTASEFASMPSRRPAMCIIIGAHGAVCVSTDNARYVGSAFLFGPNVERSISADDAHHYSLNLDPTHQICRYLRTEILKGHEVIDLSQRLDGSTRAVVKEAVNLFTDCAEVYRTSQAILDTLFPEAFGREPIDTRIDLVASWLWTHVPARAELGFLAELCGLSTSRLAHLFTSEIGISIRQYLLWVKMRKAAELFVKNVSMTEVAHSIGFSDSAHLSRTFMRYFAHLPSELSNRRLVRVQLCDGSAR